MKNTKKKRKALYKQQQHCTYCFKELRFDEATLDHIIPKSRGGTYASKNLTLACQKCNQAKGKLSKKQFQLTLLPRIEPEYEEPLNEAENEFVLLLSEARKYSSNFSTPKWSELLGTAIQPDKPKKNKIHISYQTDNSYVYDEVLKGYW